jgi:hypothetical protein
VTNGQQNKQPMARTAPIFEAFARQLSALNKGDLGRESTINDANRLNGALERISLLVSADPELSRDPEAKWLLDTASYSNLMELWLQYFCVAAILDLRRDKLTTVTPARVLVRVIDSSAVEAICLREPPYAFIVLSRGCYEICHGRALLQLLIGNLGTAIAADNSIKINLLSGEDVERVLANTPQSAIPFLDNYIALEARSSYDPAKSSLPPLEQLAIAANDDAFHDAAIALADAGGDSEITDPMVTVAQHCPVLYMLSLVFHEFGHVMHDVDLSASKRSMDEEAAADLRAVNLFCRMQRSLGGAQNPVGNCLAGALFYSVTRLHSFCQETSFAAGVDSYDVSVHYMPLQGKVEPAEPARKGKEVWEHQIIGARGQGISSTIAAHYPPFLRSQIVDLFWDYAAALEILADAIARRWLTKVLLRDRHPDDVIPARKLQSVLRSVNHHRAKAHALASATPYIGLA